MVIENCQKEQDTCFQVLGEEEGKDEKLPLFFISFQLLKLDFDGFSSRSLCCWSSLYNTHAQN